ncbi:hypothetical protein CC1G_00016 [Coprinopsis cinerea okayama7|uniref:DUF962 domain-containing protein n=1 Tax=Coprinopsis cinerea (strain Okayama-7 / 130 / ATCC MYA-4618 / FGSC 9003) TaxID=240176 RepID=A8NWF3_COPC7|nr:hypothetical protein CC1G_00016 [Coprinopsis cinerea okayama7\|eukprot:XP_001836880.1 hypothetical protein CC1G_00016 [Coprinopsis cinerea okayama7\
MPADLLNVDKQLTFYGAYHSNKINVLIHIICVPLILWSAEALVAPLQTPSWIPKVHYQFNEYLVFDLNWSAIHALVYIVYYFLLEPVAALLYIPQLVLSLLTATAFSYRADNITIAGGLHAISWIAQFIGHGFAEKRAPALLDNLIGAVVLAPFFVHLELLFALGYRPEMHKRIKNAIGVEITKIRKAEGEKRRKEGKKEL